MSQQADLNRGVPFRLASANVSAQPTDGVTQPHVTMSPIGATNLLTTGLFFGFKAPTNVTAATAGAGGFTVVIWIANMVTLSWFSSSSVSVSYDQAFSTFDFNAAALFFQVTNVSVAGSIDVHLIEQ